MGAKGSKPKLSKKEIDFFKRNTKFTEDEIKERYSSFVALCPSGVLSKRQFVEIYKDYFQASNADGFCENVFRTFDADKSGYIDFKEFLLSLYITRSGTPKEKLERAFNLYDINNDGTIDEKEMIKIIEGTELLNSKSTNSADNSAKNKALEIFKKIDVNQDKKICWTEFLNACSEDRELFQTLTNEPWK